MVTEDTLISPNMKIGIPSRVIPKQSKLNPPPRLDYTLSMVLCLSCGKPLQRQTLIRLVETGPTQEEIDIYVENVIGRWLEVGITPKDAEEILEKTNITVPPNIPLLSLGEQSIPIQWKEDQIRKSIFPNTPIRNRVIAFEILDLYRECCRGHILQPIYVTWPISVSEAEKNPAKLRKAPEIRASSKFPDIKFDTLPTEAGVPVPASGEVTYQYVGSMPIGNSGFQDVYAVVLPVSFTM